MFLKRLGSSVFLVLIFLLTIFLLPKWAFALFLILLCVLASFEFFQLIEKKGVPAVKGLGIFIAAAIPFAIFKEFELTEGWELFFIVAAILILFIIQFRRKDNSNAIIAISITLFGIFYIGWLLSFVIRLFLLPMGNSLVLFLLIVTKMGDVSAYIIGTKFGKHSLIKRISPQKTIEGAAGAFLTSLLCACLFKFYMPQIPMYHFLLLGILLGTMGQIGDLSESLIKRDCQVKDAGFFIPGFGGVLDVIDSILFAAPTLYFYVTHTAIITP